MSASNKEDSPNKHKPHRGHHHHHHEDENTAITVRFRPVVEEVLTEEVSETTPLDSVHSPTSLQANIPRIQIATTPPGCTCHSGTSNSSRSGSSACSICFIKQQTPRSYVQDLEGHWYRFAPDVDLKQSDRTDVYKGSDGRAYKRISVQKVPPHELRRHAREHDGANNYGQRRHSRHHGHGHNHAHGSAVPAAGYAWLPTPTTPAYQAVPIPTAFMRFKKVFRRPSSLRSWGTTATYDSPAGGPMNPPNVYAVPMQPIRSQSRRHGWSSVFHYFAGGGGGGYSSRKRNTHNFRTEPNIYDNSGRKFSGGSRPPDGGDGYGRFGN